MDLPAGDTQPRWQWIRQRTNDNQVAHEEESNNVNDYGENK